LLSDIRASVAEQCVLFTQRTRIEITRPAEELASEIISVIIEDPHPSWRSENINPRDLANQFVSDMQQNLQRIVDEEHVQHRITAFDLLHWLTRNFLSLCPIPK
jgi:hypothetical protein